MSVVASTAKQAGVVVGLAVLAGVCFHMLLPQGLWRNFGATQRTIENNRGWLVPSITAHQARELADAVFVDARNAEDRAKGLIQGAVHIPVSAAVMEGGTEIVALLAGVDRGRAVVVFCDADCSLDRAVAGAIYNEGWRNVYRLRGGYAALARR